MQSGREGLALSPARGVSSLAGGQTQPGDETDAGDWKEASLACLLARNLEVAGRWDRGRGDRLFV